MTCERLFALRTPAEIVDKLRRRRQVNVLGHVPLVLAIHLSAHDIQEFIAVDPHVWTPRSMTNDGLVAEMREYMMFAWKRVREHDGMSGTRSVEKMGAWLWLLGDDEAWRYTDAACHYRPYGAPVLAYICARYGFPIPEGDDLTRMAAGLPCEPGCRNGCGI